MCAISFRRPDNQYAEDPIPPPPLIAQLHSAAHGKQGWGLLRKRSHATSLLAKFNDEGHVRVSELTQALTEEGMIGRGTHTEQLRGLTELARVQSQLLDALQVNMQSAQECIRDVEGVLTAEQRAEVERKKEARSEQERNGKAREVLSKIVAGQKKKRDGSGSHPRSGKAAASAAAQSATNDDDRWAALRCKEPTKTRPWPSSPKGRGDSGRGSVGGRSGGNGTSCSAGLVAAACERPSTGEFHDHSGNAAQPLAAQPPPPSHSRARHSLGEPRGEPCGSSMMAWRASARADQANNKDLVAVSDDGSPLDPRRSLARFVANDCTASPKSEQLLSDEAASSTDGWHEELAPAAAPSDTQSSSHAVAHLASVAIEVGASIAVEPTTLPPSTHGRSHAAGHIASVATQVGASIAPPLPPPRHHRRASGEESTPSAPSTHRSSHAAAHLASAASEVGSTRTGSRPQAEIALSCVPPCERSSTGEAHHSGDAAQPRALPPPPSRSSRARHSLGEPRGAPCGSSEEEAAWSKRELLMERMEIEEERERMREQLVLERELMRLEMEREAMYQEQQVNMRAVELEKEANMRAVELEKEANMRAVELMKQVGARPHRALPRKNQRTRPKPAK